MKFYVYVEPLMDAIDELGGSSDEYKAPALTTEAHFGCVEFSPKTEPDNY